MSLIVAPTPWSNFFHFLGSPLNGCTTIFGQRLDEERGMGGSAVDGAKAVILVDGIRMLHLVMGVDERSGGPKGTSGLLS